MTSNDLHKQKIFQLWLYAYQTKASNPGNTVAATNLVFDLLMTSNDMHNAYDMHKTIIFIFGGHFGPYEVIRAENFRMKYPDIPSNN